MIKELITCDGCGKTVQYKRYLPSGWFSLYETQGEEGYHFCQKDCLSLWMMLPSQLPTPLEEKETLS